MENKREKRQEGERKKKRERERERERERKRERECVCVFRNYDHVNHAHMFSFVDQFFTQTHSYREIVRACECVAFVAMLIIHMYIHLTIIFSQTYSYQTTPQSFCGDAHKTGNQYFF